MRPAPGAVIFDGPSELDGQPILAIVSWRSGNAKTGQMAQVWILRRDASPVDAAQTGRDASVCGDCPLRRSAGGACYVLLPKAPMMVHRAWRAGRYPTLAPRDAGRGRLIRLGAYGDPAAVPIRVWRQLLREAQGWTGYTHQWRRRPALRRYVMASCDTEADAAAATAAGWRTFRVRREAARLLPNEIVCPASAEGGYRVQCAQCRLCCGTTRSAKNIAIIAHGANGMPSRMPAEQSIADADLELMAL